EENVQQYMLFPVWSSGSKNPQNSDGDAAFEVKEPEFKGKKPESKVHVSPSSSAQSTKHYDKTKREDKVVPSQRSIMTRPRERLKVNAAGSLVPTVGKISSNSTNTFSAAGPSNTADSPMHGRS
nr:hypothetical protein [Tanacetum cinerariifolium]